MGEECCRVLDSLRSVISDTQSNISSLKDSQERTNGTVQTLRRELSEVSASTAAVRAGLKEQSSILLPNLHLGSQETREAAARHGSLLQGGAFGGMATSRKPAS